MRDAIALDFFLFALILSGLLTSSLSYIREEYSQSQEIKLWLTSIIMSVLGLILFGIGTATTAEALKSNSIVFTFANALYLASIFFQTLFCFSLRAVVSRKTIYFAIVAVLVIALHFEYLRESGNFIGRVLEIAFFSSVLLIAQLSSLAKSLSTHFFVQLRFLFAFTLLELACVILRIVVSALQVNPVLSINEIPLSLLAVVWFNLAFNVLSYLTMIGYWSERAKLKRVAVNLENERITALLNEREKLINSLLISNKSVAMGALSASIAHELNQPIGASRINLFTLKKKLASNFVDDYELVNIIHNIEVDNQRTGDIVAALRSIFSQEPQHVAAIQLLELVSSTVKLASPALRKSQINLHVDVAADLTIRANRVELQQVLLNLINNAIEALNESKLDRTNQIVLNACGEDGYVSLRVTDNGPGIPSERVPHLFELFSTDKKTGLGIGLWLSRYIMERTGGNIRYRPNPEGGSQFVLSIPR